MISLELDLRREIRDRGRHDTVGPLVRREADLGRKLASVLAASHSGALRLGAFAQSSYLCWDRSDPNGVQSSSRQGYGQDYE